MAHLTGRPEPLPAPAALPETVGYRLKRRLLGPPLVTRQIRGEKLSKTLALGVLSSDCISSSAYGSEEMLLVLLGTFGIAGFTILMPLTGVILLILVLMTLSYREVVTVYTKAGGSYVVARENFGPRVAQVAAVALMVDYVVTVAVQSAAGTAAVISAIPALNSYNLEITLGVVLVLCYGNLRGLREAGRAFAFPTYFFIGSMAVVMITGLLRDLFGDLPVYTHTTGMIAIHDKQQALVTFGAIFILLRAFANGGSSLTGLEAISNGVSAFRRPEGQNARRTLSTMSVVLGAIVLGVSWLAFRTHATPYADGSPTVISQVVKASFGSGPAAHVGFLIVQLATMLILYTGANTPFNGFPFLASFVAEDSFLPRQLTRRGHRLAFSNGILILAALAIALLLATGAHVDTLVPFYAIGVFTGFTMAGFGMARYHRTHHEPGWRRRLAINAAGGAASALVVLIFAVVKFTEGAWVIIVLFPILVVALIRLNGKYRAEARALDLTTRITATPPNFPGLVVLLFVDRLDLAVIRALRYAGGLHATEVRAVHFMVDDKVATDLQAEWVSRGLAERVALEIVECPDRRLLRAVEELVDRTVGQDRTEVTVVLPRRTYSRLLGHLLHDRTANAIAAHVSRMRHVSATIVPFDTTLPPDVEQHLEERAAGHTRRPAVRPRADLPDDYPDLAVDRSREDRDDTTPIADAGWRERVCVEGRIRSVREGSAAGQSLECQLVDTSGGVRLLFYGQQRIPGLTPGTWVRAEGTVGRYQGHLAIANPEYTLLPGDPPAEDQS